MSAEVVLGLDAVLTIDGAEIKNVKDLTVSLEKAEADASTRDNNDWRATENADAVWLTSEIVSGRITPLSDKNRCPCKYCLLHERTSPFINQSICGFFVD